MINSDNLLVLLGLILMILTVISIADASKTIEEVGE